MTRHVCVRMVAGVFSLLVTTQLWAQQPQQTGLAPVPATLKQGSTELPLIYRPMDEPPRYNSNEPSFVPDTAEMAKLKFQTPQWLRQVITFPPPGELQKHLGTENQAVRTAAGEAIRKMINPGLLPDGFVNRMIPLSGWAVLYEDWVNHGGTDVFLIKFTYQNHTVLIAESHNHIILLIRNLSHKRTGDLAETVRMASSYADVALSEHMKPLSPEAMKMFKSSITPIFVYGYYFPRIDAVSGKASTEDLVTTGGAANDRYSSARATAVRFFCNGDFAAFMLLKPLMGGDLKNPFEPRFPRANKAEQTEVPFWEAKPGDRGTEEEIQARQIEEYLGSFFFDEQGNKLSQHIALPDLERAFMELSPEQKVAVVEKRVIDEYYAAGIKAYAAKDYLKAIEHWNKILQTEPENPRAAILLQLAIRSRAQQAYQGNTEKARADAPIRFAQDLLSRQQTVLALKGEQAQQDKVKETAITNFRTRALDFLSENNYAASLKEWEKILAVDPGHPSALFFKDMCEKRIRQGERRIRSRR